MIDKKVEVRKNLLRLRDSINQHEIKEMSNLISQNLKKLDKYKSANTIFYYINLKNEVETRKMISESISEGKKCCLPYSIKETSSLEYYKVNDLNKDLKLGSYGILEPIPDKENLVKKQDADLIIIPGVAFDLKLNRIGYGKGYYDNFLSNLPSGVLKIALAFDLQILQDIPVDEFDIRMDMIITEKRIIDKGKSNI